MKRKDWLQLAATMTIALFLGITFSVQNYIIMNNRGYPVSWHDSWTEQVPFWFVWAILSPLVFRITARFPLDRERWWTTLLMHVPSGVLFSILHFGIYFIIITILREREAVEVTNFVHFVEMLKRLNFGLRLWSYLLLVVLGYAMDFYQRYQESAVRTSQLEMQLARAQLDALKMQLHPHFLFNTLNSISALLRKDVEVADKMIARLGDFLRMTLRNSGRQEVTIAEEMEFLSCYLEIERIRFQDRLTVEVDIEPGASEARVPNLLLQPIVENAIRHGISATTGAGKLRIQAKRNDGRLDILVRDNGPGLSPDANGYREGVGMQNTRARLEQMYGEDHRMKMYNAEEGGLVVELELPYRTTTGDLK